MQQPMDLTDEQWSVVEPLIGQMPRRADGRGRPWRSSREVLDGIRWILRTGAQWQDVPERYPPYQTCHRRFQRWVREETMMPTWDYNLEMVQALARHMRQMDAATLRR